jgi:two-component system, LytTR family, response regulator
MDNINSLQQKTLEVKTPSGYKVICIKDILYVVAARKFSIVYLNDNNIIITYYLLKWYDKYLLTPPFFRCHHSYIVNCQFVDFYCNKRITLKNMIKIPLSRNKIWSFKENLKYSQMEL